ncbi:MAG TPA: hypothetical protein VLA64_01220 [Azonexus sp.]|nr:hypothetical protein [Azonexus sp.]
MKDFTRKILDTFIFHAVASHFINGLVPVAFLFMVLTLITADPYYEHTVIHLICIAFLAIPFSFFSGIRDWRKKFQCRRAPIFYHKIRLSILLALLCAAVIPIRLVWSNPFAEGGGIAWLYGGCIFMALPVVILLGHLGGKLAYMVRQRYPEGANPSHRTAKSK